MTKELEKYVITRPSRFDNSVAMSIEKVFVGETVINELNGYELIRTTLTENSIPQEWWEKKK
jgi:hypothetical protein